MYKTRVLIMALLGVSVGLVLIGLGEKYQINQKLVEKYQVIPKKEQLSIRSGVIATLDGGRKVITLNKEFNLVCVENSRWGVTTPQDTAAAFSCWDVDVAPKKVRELVEKQKSTSMDCGLGPC